MVPVIAFVGRHNSGKTTILAKVINILQLRGIKSGVIKHSHHSPTPDNHDSGKLFAAGAEQVFLSTPYVSLLYRREEEKRLDTIIEQINLQVDIIFLEGYKKSQHPKIEIIRQEVDAHPLGVSNVIARVTDGDGFEDQIPLFRFGQEAELADFLVQKFIKLDVDSSGGGADA
ncbi:MAG: molybdopterin-guanine dinucleotide biosynthesis protein B [Syntrophomonadaceae bacterium]|jgi:molybdopterin-guanine dinucleotide biosynthesis protein B|nr:molybdopterin-guanine dinucleotide biosynthesis protein B [Bacillota bacterium]NLM87664.1 molybdopterin-guanine dinucleotide biosynthesis protein B [Syntrophomonadaceae bacterium]HAA08963.1 molybdopterin-guanine dinucleotide biosynthesis protein B [Syntrophomonas sp.]HQA49912.1 molybdopterin-guanine dinucleotide biosynthesis protein B [Syntrophomonadaceae bacterium]HQD90588.1 molybdopterin-guanine dinucleotide biosynthesis protein B [Syntrophomonadaceae bacterium]